MKILITGFDPFGGETVNPAYEAVKLLPDTIAGAEIIKLEVPTRFHRAGAVLEDAMQRHKPDAVICVGQAGGRAWPIASARSLPSRFRSLLATLSAVPLARIALASRRPFFGAAGRCFCPQRVRLCLSFVGYACSPLLRPPGTAPHPHTPFLFSCTKKEPLSRFFSF